MPQIAVSVLLGQQRKERMGDSWQRPQCQISRPRSKEEVGGPCVFAFCT